MNPFDLIVAPPYRMPDHMRRLRLVYGTPYETVDSRGMKQRRIDATHASGGRYMPHQGQRECARRMRQGHG